MIDILVLLLLLFRLWGEDAVIPFALPIWGFFGVRHIHEEIAEAFHQLFADFLMGHFATLKDDADLDFVPIF